MSTVRINQMFGDWLVQAQTESKDKKNSWFQCLCCLCGNKKDVIGYALLNGRSKSCGCQDRFKNSGKKKGIEERRKRIREFLKMGYSIHKIMSQVSTSYRTIKHEIEKENKEENLKVNGKLHKLFIG